MFYFHSALISSVLISPVLCCLYHRSVVLGRFRRGFKAPKKKGRIFASVVSKGSQPSKRPYISKADSVRQKLHPGCRDCTNPCSCTVLTIKTTFKTLLVIKRNTCISFPRNKKDSRESHIIIHSINYIVDRTWKYI